MKSKHISLSKDTAKLDHLSCGAISMNFITVEDQTLFASLHCHYSCFEKIEQVVSEKNITKYKVSLSGSTIDDVFVTWTDKIRINSRLDELYKQEAYDFDKSLHSKISQSLNRICSSKKFENHLGHFLMESEDISINHTISLANHYNFYNVSGFPSNLLGFIASIPMSNHNAIKQEYDSMSRLLYALLEEDENGRVIFTSKGKIGIPITYNSINLERTRGSIETLEYIYLFKDPSSGFIKIGKSQNVKKRLKQLKVGNPLLQFVTCYLSFKFLNLEQELHEKFKAERMCGEWFNVNPQNIHAFIEEFYGLNHFTMQELSIIPPIK